MTPLPLQTVAALLHCPVESVLGLIVTGALTVVVQDGHALVSAASVRAYVLAQPLPPDILAMQRHARWFLAAVAASRAAHPVAPAALAEVPSSSCLVHVARLEPHLHIVVMAADARAYDVARAAWHTVWQLMTDYDMLERPLDEDAPT